MEKFAVEDGFYMPGSILLEKVRETCRVKHMSPKTELAYHTWIKRYIYFNHKKHPSELNEEHISRYLSLLADKGHIA